MEILFISNVMSKQSYDELCNERTIRRVEPSQKFFSLIVNGMMSKNNHITCLTVKPIYHAIYSKLFIKNEKELIDDQLSYEYVGFVNFPLFKQFSLMQTVKKSVKRWIKSNKGKDCIIVVDPMLIDATHVAIKVAKKHNIKVVSFITDIPSLTIGTDGALAFLKRKFINMSDNDLKKFDAHILLTEQMNELFNSNNRPYLIVESVVPMIDIVDADRVYNNHPFSIMYAGKLHEQFGIKNLVDAFVNIDDDNMVLNIYGDGDAVEYIQDMCAKDSRINYNGVVPVEVVEAKEREISLLVNPRPTSEAFTKYSFPSKTVEYLLSATPFLSTALPGIPEEYFEYVNKMTDDSPEGIRRAILDAKATPYSTLVDRAKRGRKFVISNKNNIIQGKRIMAFLADQLR